MKKKHSIELTCTNDLFETTMRLELSFDDPAEFDSIRLKAAKLLIDEWAALDTPVATESTPDN